MGMITVIVWLAFIYIIAQQALQFQRNLKAAKASGVPVVIVPWHQWFQIGKLFTGIFLKVFPHLPTFLQPPEWLWFRFRFMDNDCAYHMAAGEYFDRFANGGDNIIIVALFGPPPLGHYNIFQTRDAAVINDMVAKRNDIQKPIDVYGLVDVYGRSILSSEGKEWAKHRKVVGPSFNDKNNLLVWKESLYVARLMLDGWIGTTNTNQPVTSTGEDTERIALFVISRAAFGMSMTWPASGENKDEYLSKSVEVPPGHKLSYDATMNMLQRNLIALLLVPRWLMRSLPSKRLNRLYIAYHEFAQYMNESMWKVTEEVEKGTKESDKGAALDLLTNFVRASGQGSSKPILTSQEILANAYLSVFAGYETSAHTQAFAIHYLAMHPEYQIELQEAIKRIGRGRPVSEWSYPDDFMAFEEGVALMYETLRLCPPVPALPKAVTSLKTVELRDRNNKSIYLPPKTRIIWDIANIQRHPGYWGDNAQAFDMDRWLVHNDSSRKVANTETIDKPMDLEFEDIKDEKLNQPVLHTTKNLFVPEKGSFLAFSEGPRACLGRKFAIVEFVAIFATLFENHGVELDLQHDPPKGQSSWVHEQEVEHLGKAQAIRNGYARRAVETRSKINRSHQVGSLTMFEIVGVRWVKKGEEVWRSWVEQ